MRSLFNKLRKRLGKLPSTVKANQPAAVPSTKSMKARPRTRNLRRKGK